MNQKQSKRLRRIHRQEIGDAYEKQAREMAKFYTSIIKPKPKWVPEWLYMRLLKLFIKVKPSA